MEKQKEKVIYAAPLRAPGLVLEVVLRDGKTVPRVTDVEMGEEYLLHAIPGGNNSFADGVREEVDAVLAALAGKEPASGQDAERVIFAMAKRLYGTTPEYPWADSDAAVLRREDTRKWYAVFQTIDKEKLGITGPGRVRIVNLHVVPEEMEKRLERPGHFPGFHMNKKSWVTLLLDGSISEEVLEEELAESYRLGGREKKKRLAK